MLRPVAGLVALAFLAVTSAASQAPEGARPESHAHPVAAGQGPLVHPADAEFISGMIAHHAQAVLIAGWAPANDASPAIRRLCERIVVGQQDEIALMQQWLRDRGQPVPSGDATHAMHGMHDGALMPGMLSAAEVAELERLRGADFDRAFLAYMIKHHEGAITMVERLVGTPGAAQDNFVFKLAADINADQTIEIERMMGLLASLSPVPAGP